MNTEMNQEKEKEEISIDLLQFTRDLLKFKWTILIISLVFGILGALYSLTQANEYSSTVKMLPEIDAKQTGGLSGLKSLAGLAGVDLNTTTSTEAIRPDLYPNILQSLPFLMSSLEQKIYVSKLNKWVIIKDLFGKEAIKATISLGSSSEEEKLESEKADETNLKNLPRQALSSDVVNIDKNINSKIKALKERINAEIDKKSGIITINVKMPDPIAAASMATYAQNYLTNYVTKYRTQKAQLELDFLANRKRDAKDHYDKALFNLSTYRDQNRNIFLNVARDQERKLQYEVDIAYNMYSNLSTQLEDAKVKVHREMPVIKILEPAQVPVNKTEPKRSLITLGFLFFGFILSVVFVFLKTQNLKELFK